MRPLLFTLALLLSSLARSAHGAPEDKLLKWDLEKEYDTRKSSFGASGAVKTNKAMTKDFGGNRSFAAKEFNAKTYGGTKQSWFSSLFFNAKAANTKGKYEVPNAESKFDTKTAASKEAPEAAKSKDTREFVQAEQEFLKPGARGRWGRSQARLDDEKAGIFQKEPLGYQGDKMEPMTIGDIRELLNKNK